jgi:methionyl-tRNA formyltransferase
VSSPVAELGRAEGVDVLQPESLRDAAVLDRLRDLAPDCAPVVAYGGLVPPSALSIPRHGWVNLHFSLLPAWRGAAPVQHAIWRGDDITGASTFLIEEGLDTGPVFGTVTETIRPDDTAGSLLDRLADVGAGLLVATLDAIESGTAQAIPQTGEPSLAPKLSVDDARIRWDVPALAVDRQIRACTPAPGAWTMWGADRLQVGPVGVTTEAERLAPGALAVGRREILVGTATAPVRLSTVRAAGKREMPAADWARGVRVTDGDTLA